MPIITLGTTEPEAIIVDTGTLPDNFYSTLQTSDVEMQEPVDFDTKVSLITTHMDEREQNKEELADNVNTSNLSSMANKSKKDEPKKNGRPNEDSNTEALKDRSDLLEFSARSDGSVNCKLCGKIFSSRQHWYRHKYRAHVVHPPQTQRNITRCHSSAEERTGRGVSEITGDQGRKNSAS
ncbi:Uncharacterized protein OBRU01_13528 [Operophtera brumata]|uniref:C2H2-type domain-containing protein n=1 Tax=Operophtera brumata TaxID=104452 RepID=A0A0L7L913_OPEBR|nr:Uncharacterized protein OBRU01_13528 [Operophtera brumata]